MQPESTGASTSRSSAAGFLVAGEPLHSGDRLHLHQNGDSALSKPVRSDRLAVDHSDAGELAPPLWPEVEDDGCGARQSASHTDGWAPPVRFKTHARANRFAATAEGVFCLYAFDVAASRGLNPLWACCTVAFLAQWHSATFLFLFLSVL